MNELQKISPAATCGPGKERGRAQMLREEFEKLFGPVRNVKGVKDVGIDDQNMTSFQVAVVLDMEKFGGDWDWTSDYGFSDAKKAKVLPGVVKAVKAAFRAIEGATLHGHDSPKMQYSYWTDEFQARPKAHRMGYESRVLTIHVHWCPQEERIYI